MRPCLVPQRPRPALLQQCALPTTRQLQQLGRLDRASRQDHFSVCVCDVRLASVQVLDTDRSATIENDLGGGRFGQQHQAGRRVLAEIGLRRAAAPAAADRHLQVGSPFVAPAVVIRR